MAKNSKKSNKAKQQAVKKDFMPIFPAELIIKMFSTLPIIYTWRVQQVSKLWKAKLSSFDIKTAALYRWETHDFTEASARTTTPKVISQGIQYLRQHHRRYPSVRIMEPIKVMPITWPFRQARTSVVHPLLAGNIALICMHQHEFRFEIVDLDTRHRREVPLPTTYTYRQDMYRGKALGTKHAAFLRNTVCYLYHWQTETLQPIAIPSTKHNIDMLAVAVYEHITCIVYSDGEQLWNLFHTPERSMYLRVPTYPIVRPSVFRGDAPICAAMVDREKFIFFWIEDNGFDYTLALTQWNLRTGKNSGRRMVIDSDMCFFRTGGLLTIHSTGVKDQIRVRVAGQDGDDFSFYNMILDLNTSVVFDHHDLQYGGTYWKHAKLVTTDEEIMYQICDKPHGSSAAERQARQTPVLMDCFALDQGCSMFPPPELSAIRQQYVVNNESYMIVGTFRGTSTQGTQGLVWDFFSFNDRDDGVPLVIDREKSDQLLVSITLAA